MEVHKALPLTYQNACHPNEQRLLAYYTEDGEKKECLLTVGRNVNCIVMKSCVEIPQDIKATVGT